MAGESYRDVLQRQQEALFVARASELAKFQENLALPAGEPKRHLIFCVHGDGGVGKTTLLNQMRSIADGRHAATGWVDEEVSGALQAMQWIASDLKRHRKDMADTRKKLTTYYRQRLNVASDTDPTEGTAAFLAQMGTQALLHGAHLIPGMGGLVDYVDTAALGDELGSLVARKVRRSEDERMLYFPLDELTSAFVHDLTRAGRHGPIVLFFDSYEKTGPLLDGWLRSMLKGRYGDLPKDLTIIVAGRHPLDLRNWGSYGLADMPLAPFSEAETRQLLIRKDVADEQVVRAILEISNGLPLLVATLAQNQPTHPGQIGDLSGEAVEVFLKWERDPVLRTLAVAAATPRVLNEDILGVLVGGSAQHDADQGELFAWSWSQPFVAPEPGRHEAGRSVYHEVVRTPMIRLERGQSPTRWRERHRLLAQAFRTWRLELSRKHAWDDAAWRDHKLEETYHLLCANLVKALPHALNEMADACAHHATTAAQWAQMILQAGQDSGSEQIRAWGQRLEESLRENDDGAAAARTIALLRERRTAKISRHGLEPGP